MSATPFAGGKRFAASREGSVAAFAQRNHTSVCARVSVNVAVTSRYLWLNVVDVDMLRFTMAAVPLTEASRIRSSCSIRVAGNVRWRHARVNQIVTRIR